MFTDFMFAFSVIGMFCALGLSNLAVLMGIEFDQWSQVLRGFYLQGTEIRFIT